MEYEKELLGLDTEEAERALTLDREEFWAWYVEHAHA